METSEKKNRILNAAEELFSQQGFDGASVRSISEKAGVNIAMISYYFGSKEKLLDELVATRMAGFDDVLQKINESSSTHSEKLYLIISTLIRQVHKNRKVHKILHFEFSNGNRNINFENFINQKSKNFQVMSSLISEGQKKGEFSKNVNVKLVVPTILGTYFHYIFNKNFYQQVLGLGHDKSLDNFVYQDLTQHIQQTIYALLQNKN